MSSLAAAPPDLGLFDRFCRLLTLEQGGPLELEPFQKAMLGDYFAGATETLILISKKNGKTTLLSALALFHLITTRDCECVIGAASRDQATILYDQALGFIRRSPGLSVVPKTGYREIRSTKHHGRIRVLAADVDTADGVIPTLALVDELHRHRSAGLYGVFRDGLGPRDGQMLTISTAGDNEGSPLGLMRAEARLLEDQRRDGAYLCARSADGSYAMHEWALDRDEDTDDMQVVKGANPASWQTVEQLQRRHDSPSMLPHQWLRFACGIWASAEAYWLRGEDWQACAVADRLNDGDRITLGFDGSRVLDSTALIACRMDDGLIQPLAIWDAPGEGREIPGGEIDAAVADAMSRYRVQRGYWDPPLFQTELDGWAREFGEQAVMKFPTNRARAAMANERFRTDTLARRVRHTGDRKLAAHIVAAQTREGRTGLYWLAKSRPTSPDHIDGAVASVLAWEARCDELSTVQMPGQLLTF
jgi:hypothetical protein